MSVLALDIGSSRIKALLAKWDGQVIDVRSVKTPLRVGIAGEQAYAADAVYEAAEVLVSGIAGAYPDDSIDTIVFSCLGTAMVPVDRSERPLGPALSPADARPSMGPSQAESVGLSAERLRHLTGSSPGVPSFLLHFLWWRRTQPDVMRKLHRFRSLRGFIVHELCGADAEDRTWASRTMLMDLDTNAWSETILSAADLPAEALPQLQPSTAAWTVRASAAARFGLSPQARVVLGGMDNCCSLLGASDPSEPRLVNTVGTYEHLGGTGGLDVARTAAEAADGVVHTYLLPGRYLSMTRVPMGHLLARVADASSLPLDQLLDGVSDEPAGLDMRLAGDAVQDALDDGTSPAVVIQTLLESAAAHLMRFADSWDGATGVRSDQFVAVGGGAGRANLMQLKANLLGRSLSTLASDESAGLGALRLAAMAVRGATPSAACELFPNPIVHTWSPDAPRKDRASAAVDAGDAGLD